MTSAVRTVSGLCRLTAEWRELVVAVPGGFKQDLGDFN